MEFVSTVVGRVVDSLFGVAIKEISYMWKCSENVESLKNEAENLTNMKGRVQQRINSAKDKGDLLLEGVEAWMKKADDNLSDATEFLNKEAEAKKTCLNLRLCVNLNTVHYYGRMAEKNKSLILQLQEEGKGFETCVSFPAPTPGYADIYQRKNLENIDTQKSTLKKIIAAIEDDKIQIVAITGLGGVGKTTLASEVAASMKNQFSEIVFITVSQTVDSKMIQERVQVAAKKIIEREKVLIILDDVWEELKFEELGVPCGSDYMNCKILLTSRSTYVCEAMNAQEIIPVNPLKEGEAWALFERVVDKNVWDDKWKNVALKIVQECGGLPLFVQAVGKALKNKEMGRWETALRRLQDPTDEDAPFKRKGITQLKLSYDYLESEAAKLFFLMCSMFPEDRSIDMNRLTYYVMGLGIFNNLFSIEDAKDKVQLLVDSLQSSFLLQKMDGKSYYHYRHEDEQEELFKMHDLVRDMALVITSKGSIKFMVQSGTSLREWKPRKDLESYNKISLMGNSICELSEHKLDFPHLDTFLVHENSLSIVADEFFRGMEKLKVLDMSDNYISSLPRSLKHLTELHTLNLSYNRSLCEISILGELTCLEILNLKGTGIEKIPEVIGQLTNLRLLDVYNCEHLSYVAPSVISKLIRLEELYVQLKHNGNCNFLMELSELKSLRILHLQVPQLHYIAEDFDVENLKEFRINEDICMDKIRHFRRVLQLRKISFPSTKPIMKLIQASEMLFVWWIKDLESILPALYPKGFEELKSIILMDCENVRSLVNTHELDAMRISNVIGPMKARGKFFSQLEEMKLIHLDRLEVLWDNPHQYISFSNLVEIYVTHCHSLLKLFPLSVAQGLVKLRRLYVIQCTNLEVVISAGDGDEKTGGSEIELVKHDTYSVFPLTYICLSELPKLESFYSGHSTIKYPSLDEIYVTCCHSMKRWSYGENHIPKLKFEHEGRSYSNINDYITVQHEINGKLEIHCREDKVVKNELVPGGSSWYETSYL